MAIVMTGFFDPGDLPGGPQDGVTSDSSSWSEVWNTAQYVFEQCCEANHSAGWDATGNLML